MCAQVQEDREQPQKPCVLEEGAEATFREAGGESPLGGGESSDINTNMGTSIGLMEKQKGERLNALVGLVVITAGEVLEVTTTPAVININVNICTPNMYEKPGPA